MAADTSMDIDMDADIELDLDIDPEVARMQAEADALNALPTTVMQEDIEVMNGIEGVEEGEIGPGDIAATKVHVEGLDQLTTQDIQNFVHDNHKTDEFRRVEWIDDNSANIVYHTEAAAEEGLQALSASSADDPLEARRAVTLATHPHVELYVRMARITDAKEPGAAKRSRFYLLHPEHDPENKPKRRRYDDPRRSGPRRGGYQDERASRRSSQSAEPFDVDLYDDTTAAKQAVRERRSSQQSDEDLIPSMRSRTRPERRNVDLFATKEELRLRDRSASPARDGDGRFGFSDDQPYRRTARRRSPLRSRSKEDNYGARDTMKKELIRTKKIPSVLTDEPGENGPIELFPQHSSSSNGKTELFPEKVNHRRQDAKDLHPDEVASAIGKWNLEQAVDTLAYNSCSSGRRPDNGRDRNVESKPRDLFARTNQNESKPRDLFSRIGGGSGLAMNATAGRLNERPASAGDLGDGFNIKGAGKDTGFSFKGASRDTPPVKELFPTRAGSGQDLFAGKMQSRGAPRRRAEDAF